MNYSKLKAIMAMVLVASLFALAGCGGGSSKPTTTTPDPTPPPPDYGGQLLMYHEAAVDAVAMAEGAGMAASAALKSAMESDDMLTTTEVSGDSTKAMMNAQAILDAKDTVAQALMDAEKAKMDAMDAKAAVEMIPDGTAGKNLAIEALDAAIKTAEDEINAVTAIRDGDDLYNAVLEVIGANGKRTPRSIADAVGTAIAASLAYASATPAGDSVQFSFDFSAATSAVDLELLRKSRVLMDDHQGMTWAEIVGEANVMKKRIGTISGNQLAPGIGELSVASIAGMAASAVDKTGVTDSTPAGTPVLSATGGTNGIYPDGLGQGTASVTGTPGTEYKGIPGVVVCLGGTGGCSVGSDGTLSDGWYFSPTSTTNYYVRNTDMQEARTKPYVLETLYATYGYWLRTGSPNFNVHAHVGSTAGTTEGTHYELNTVNTGATATTLTDTSATYSGSAAGWSVLRTPKSGGTGNHVDSGNFTADVSLQATFGTHATLGGTVDNFQGNAVNPNWSVTLQTKGFNGHIDVNNTDTSNITAQGQAIASGSPGVWGARAYGDGNTKRPVGIFGQFGAHFSDGDVAGAYATRKD